MSGTVRLRVTAGLVAAVGICALVGCGPKRPTTIPVTGTVTLDGQPVEGAAVAFFPEGAEQPARGVTDAAGKFTLMTFVAGDGALPGQHRVSVTKTQAPPPQAIEVGGEKVETPTDGGAAENVKYLLPPQYASPSTSQLTAEVKKGMEPVALDLKSQ
jgi:hypothetical protein